MREKDPWEVYYRSPAKKKRYKLHLVQSVVAIVLFAVVWVLGASGSELGRESGRIVWQALTAEGDFMAVRVRAEELWKSAVRYPFFETVKAVTARPVSPLNYLASPVEGKLVVPFGVSSDGTYHEEVEWEVPIGTPVKAVAAGKVLDVVRDEEGLSRSVIVQSGPITVRYGYLSETWVAVGDLVVRAEPIGRSGKKNDGFPRLSLAIRERGSAVDPMTRIRAVSDKARTE